MNNLSVRLKEWYCHLDEMYEGSIMLATDIKENIPKVGDIVRFLGGAFYVIASEHHWNYGGNPETVLSVSRGSNYERVTGKHIDKKVEEKTEIVHEDTNYTVKPGDQARPYCRNAWRCVE
jgi:signal peptidase I